MSFRPKKLKKILHLSLLLTALACQGTENNVPTTPADDSLDDLQGASAIQPIAVATLSSLGSYNSSGQVELLLSEETQMYSLVFQNFSSSNGPDLKVYLTNDEDASSFLDLGDLKSTSGTLRYDFPASQYRSELTNVMIWCQEFSVGFGIGEFVAP